MLGILGWGDGGGDWDGDGAMIHVRDIGIGLWWESLGWG
jgi:hypothetical protein